MVIQYRGASLLTMQPKRTASSANSSDSRIANIFSARPRRSRIAASSVNRTRLVDPQGTSVTPQPIAPAHGPQRQDWPMPKKYWQGHKCRAPHSGPEEEFPHASHREEHASHADSGVTLHDNAPSTQIGKKRAMRAHASQRWITMRVIHTKPYMWHEQ